MSLVPVKQYQLFSYFFLKCQKKDIISVLLSIILCKYYCSEGLGTLSADNKWDFILELCPKNYYCKGGDRYQSVTGSCSRDFFCPKVTDIPSFTKEGNIILGNVTIEIESYSGNLLLLKVVAKVA